MAHSSDTPLTASRARSVLNRDGRSTALLTGLLSVLATGCSVDTNPVAPDTAGETASVQESASPQSFLTGPTHVMEPGVFDLVSRSDTLGGVYQYRITDLAAPTIERDDFIVGRDGDVFVRRVLNAERTGDDLRLETSRAYWHEVIEGGTVGGMIPLGGEPPVVANATALGGATDLPTVAASLDDVDVCFLTDSLLALIPGNLDLHLCGEERDFSVGVAAVGLTVKGTMTELFIDEGWMEVSGTMSMETTIDEGGVVGGRAPIFSPCNLSSYPGCLVTPTGAALVDFFREYAPQIPDGSLEPVRVCIPGTPIRIRAGRWDRSGLIPKWIPPVYKKCQVTDVGELPTVVLPSLERFNFTPMPNLKGRLVMDVKGTGGLQLKATVPGYTGVTAGAKFGDHLSLKGTVGLFLRIDVDMSEAGARIAVDFDEGVVVTTNWTDDAGWTGDVTVTRTDIGGVIDPIGADSIRMRGGLTVELTGTACAAILGKCELDESADTTGGASFELKLGAEAQAVLFRFLEGQWWRTENDNWAIDTDVALEVELEAGLNLPLEDFWVPPTVPIKWNPDAYQIDRTDIHDHYGTGRMQIVTTTTGPSPDTDGYQALVERADTLPRIIEAGTERLGPSLDHGLPLPIFVESNASTPVSPIKPPPCQVVYTDILLHAVPFGPAIIDFARRQGAGPPRYAIPNGCLLLIADHRVTLNGVADNCEVTGGNSQVVALQQRNLIEQRSDTTFVEFDIVCSDPPEPLGALDISTTYTGDDPDPTGYVITIDGTSWGSIDAEDARRLTGLTAGSRSVRLDDIADNCVVAGANPANVIVTSGGIATLDFEVACEVKPTPAGAVRVSTVTTGLLPDLDGYSVRLDGVEKAVVDASGTVDLPGFEEADTAVLYIGDVADNCRLDGLSPTTVTIDPITLTGSAPFALSCTDRPITTASGSIFVTTLPTPTANLRMGNGSTLQLSGDLTAELLRLSGVSVRVRGVPSAGSLELYGYELEKPTTGDPRRTGIVVHRDGEYWLFGNGAVRLVDAPARLVGQVGRLVWVTGRDVGAGLVPEAFGIIREGR